MTRSLLRHTSVLTATLATLALLSSTAHAQLVAYDNVGGAFSGFAATAGGAALQGSNTITRLIADDINAGGNGGRTVFQTVFSVANLNAGAVSARARIRFYTDNAGAPGNVIAGFTFNPISFAGSTVTSLTFNQNNQFVIPASGKFWAGITFDNNNGGTGATAAQLNNMGMGIFGTPIVGSSADLLFRTTAAGSNLVNNPAGGLITFGGTPKANLGWKFSVAPEPGTLGLLTLGFAGLLAHKRRKK